MASASVSSLASLRLGRATVPFGTHPSYGMPPSLQKLSFFLRLGPVSATTPPGLASRWPWLLRKHQFCRRMAILAGFGPLVYLETFILLEISPLKDALAVGGTLPRPSPG